MENRANVPETDGKGTGDAVLDGWYRQAGLRRLFLPGDFRQALSQLSAETLVCYKITYQSLVMTDETLTKAASITAVEAGNFSIDPAYRPQEFRDQTVKIIANDDRVDCEFCNGGFNDCQPSVDCRRCDRSGAERIFESYEEETKTTFVGGRSGGYPITTTKIKNRQKGTITETVKGPKSSYRAKVTISVVTDPCRDCKRSGRTGVQVCRACSGAGEVKVPCKRCGGSGQEACNLCQGQGKVPCRVCRGAGFGVKGDIITRNYRRDVQQSYLLSGLSENEFKNGLSQTDFDSLDGKLFSEEPQHPEDPNTVLAQRSIHSYDVESSRYEYKNREISLNRITSESDEEKYVTSGLPVSGAKALIAAALAGVPVLAVAALLVAL